MKKLLIILLLLLGSFTHAQNNLVPNGSFENITQCPIDCFGATTSTLAIGWINPNNGSSDLFSICDTVICGGLNRPCHSVPLNCWGYQNPYKGDNYGGMALWGNPQFTAPNVREYTQIKLIDSLKATKKYCVSFYTSIADSFSGYSTSRIGSYISKSAISNYTQYLINVVPQIENPYHNFLNNDTGWTAIQGVYTAGGGENYITIGNFYNDVNTDTLSFLNQSIKYPGSYYYIDDVSLTEYSEAYAGNDTTICKGVYASLGNLQNTFGAMYNWSILSGDSSSIAAEYDTAAHVWANPKKTTTYVLQKQQCGIFSYDTITVKIPATYIANAGKDTAICIGDTAAIGINNCSWCNYNWQNINVNTALVNVYPFTSTTYTLHLQDSCNTTSSLVTISVDYCQSPIVTMPNIFTPNGDDINDMWQPIIQNPLSILNYQCTIYDRWGIKTFETSNYANGFDGHTTSGLAANEGTYFYILTYTDAKTNKHKMLKGFLELVR